MSKAKKAGDDDNDNTGRGDIVKIATMSYPMSESRLGNRCISAGKSFMEHLLLIDSSQRSRRV